MQISFLEFYMFIGVRHAVELEVSRRICEGGKISHIIEEIKNEKIKNKTTHCLDKSKYFYH